MSDMDDSITSPAELLGLGRRHLAVRDYNAAAEALAKACEQLAKEHGDTADQCADAYLWYGKALLGLSREESGVIGDGVPGAGNEDDEEDDDEQDDEENGDDNGKEDAKEIGKEVEKSEAHSTTKELESTSKESKSEKSEKSQSKSEEPGSTSEEPESTDKESDSENIDPESTIKFYVPGSSTESKGAANPKTTNSDENEESFVNMDNEDDVDNLQLAWEMLDLARSILFRRVQDGGGDAARASLADVHLALGEVALESETYDKAITDMQSCLDLQKELYGKNDRRIAETHYQIGLANSLASNFEDAITHFKNAANILETRVKMLEDPTTASEDVTVKKFSSTDPLYTIEGEIKELKELLPEIQEKIHDMMDYKAETIKRVRETLCPSNGESSSLNGAGPSTSAPKPAASDISHLIRRKRKSSETEVEASAAKRPAT